METEGIIREVAELIAPPGPLDYPARKFDAECYLEQGREWKLEWIDRVPVEWADVLVDAIVQGQAGEDQLGDGWRIEIPELLGLWGTRHPGHIIPLLGNALAAGRERSLLIDALTQTCRPEVVPWLTPLVSQVDTMTDQETSYLVEALGAGMGPESVPLLLRIKDSIRPGMPESVDALIVYLRRARQEQGR
ncbi:MAG: hypothetical protein JO250_09420 [Armatimonadetes bacterium]|nr:hypothetical protein [Armatimonadota bacterium]